MVKLSDLIKQGLGAPNIKERQDVVLGYHDNDGSLSACALGMAYYALKGNSRYFTRRFLMEDLQEATGVSIKELEGISARHESGVPARQILVDLEKQGC